MCVTAPPSSRTACTVVTVGTKGPTCIRGPLTMDCSRYSQVGHISRRAKVPYFITCCHHCLPCFVGMGRLVRGKDVKRILGMRVHFTIPPHSLSCGDRRLP